jgi:sugar/nucleoside kinase (ribokinase family)
MIVMYKDDRLRLDPAIITVDLVHSACLVYLDNYEEQASLAAADLAAAGRIPVVADLEYLSEHTLSILSRVDTLIAPKAVLCDLTGEVDPQRLVRAVQLLGPRTVVATAGADGAFGVDAADGLVQVPSRPCRMTDSTGAGDAFHAGYVAGMCWGLDFAARLHLATHVASLKCEVSGPRLTAESVPAIRRRVLVGGRQ